MARISNGGGGGGGGGSQEEEDQVVVTEDGKIDVSRSTTDTSGDSPSRSSGGSPGRTPRTDLRSLGGDPSGGGTTDQEGGGFQSRRERYSESDGSESQGGQQYLPPSTTGWDGAREPDPDPATGRSISVGYLRRTDRSSRRGPPRRRPSPRGAAGGLMADPAGRPADSRGASPYERGSRADTGPRPDRPGPRRTGRKKKKKKGGQEWFEVDQETYPWPTIRAGDASEDLWEGAKEYFKEQSEAHHEGRGWLASPDQAAEIWSDAPDWKRGFAIRAHENVDLAGAAYGGMLLGEAAVGVHEDILTTAAAKDPGEREAAGERLTETDDQVLAAAGQIYSDTEEGFRERPAETAGAAAAEVATLAVGFGLGKAAEKAPRTAADLARTRRAAGKVDIDDVTRQSVLEGEDRFPYYSERAARGDAAVPEDRFPVAASEDPAEEFRRLSRRYSPDELDPGPGRVGGYHATADDFADAAELQMRGSPRPADPDAGFFAPEVSVHFLRQGSREGGLPTIRAPNIKPDRPTIVRAVFEDVDQMPAWARGADPATEFLQEASDTGKAYVRASGDVSPEAEALVAGATDDFPGLQFMKEGPEYYTTYEGRRIPIKTFVAQGADVGEDVAQRTAGELDDMGVLARAAGDVYDADDLARISRYLDEPGGTPYVPVPPGTSVAPTGETTPTGGGPTTGGGGGPTSGGPTTGGEPPSRPPYLPPSDPPAPPTSDPPGPPSDQPPGPPSYPPPPPTRGDTPPPPSQPITPWNPWEPTGGPTGPTWPRDPDPKKKRREEDEDPYGQFDVPLYNPIQSPGMVLFGGGTPELPTPEMSDELENIDVGMIQNAAWHGPPEERPETPEWWGL